MKERTIKVYQFSELEDEVQGKVIEEQREWILEWDMEQVIEPVRELLVETCKALDIELPIRDGEPALEWNLSCNATVTIDGDLRWHPLGSDQPAIDKGHYQARFDAIGRSIPEGLAQAVHDLEQRAVNEESEGLLVIYRKNYSEFEFVKDDDWFTTSVYDPEVSDIENAFSEVQNYASDIFQAEMDYRLKWETIQEHFEVNEYEFLETGTPA